MKVPESIVKEFKKLSFSLEEDDRLFEELKAKSKSELWDSLDWIVLQKGIYRTMESEHIAYLLDRLDEFLESFIESIRVYEMNGIKESDSRKYKLAAEEGIIKILKFQAKLIKKDQYRFLFRQLDRILEILQWSDNLAVKRCSLNILLLIVVAEEGSIRLELSYLKQFQLDQLSFFIRYYILHVNSFNSSYTELSELFRFDDPLFYKLEMVNNPAYKKKTLFESSTNQSLSEETAQDLIDQETNITENTITQQQENFQDLENKQNQQDSDVSKSKLASNNQTEVPSEEELKKQFIQNKEINWQTLLKNASYFEFFDNSINTKTFTSLSTKPILQKTSPDERITLTLSYDDSLTLYANAKKVFKDQIGVELHESICLFQGLKERLLIFRELGSISSRIEISSIFLLTIQILSFLMKSSKKHMQSIITEQQLAFEKFQKTFPKQVTELIHLKLNPQLQADVIRFMLTIIKEHSQLRKGTEDYLAKQSDSLIYKIYTDCSNLELTIDETTKDQNQMESEENIHNKYKVTSKGSTVQEDTLINSKFIDYALKFVNTILKYPDNQGIQEVTPFAMNFVRTPWKCEYIPYNLRQLEKALNSLALMVQHDEIQREHKIMTKILEKIEYYLEVIPKYQWLDGKWVVIPIKDYDIFLGELLGIVNQIFEAGHKRLRRIAPQLAKSLVELPKFFGLLGVAIDRLKGGYPAENSSNDNQNSNISSEKIKEKNNILLIEAVHLLSNINKENPNLIEKLMNENIIQKTISALQVMPLPHNPKALSHIIYFLYHVSLKEQGRKEIMSSGLLEKTMEIFVEDDYSEELYALTLNSVTEALHNYYNNIKEIVPIIQEKLEMLLVTLKKKCATFTENVEEYLSLQQSKESQPTINIKYRQILCYQVVNVCKVLEKLTTGIDNVYPDMKNEFASECLHSYLEILQFPFLFLMPQRTTHKTPFFSVKTTCKAIYSKLGDKSEKVKNRIHKVLELTVMRLEQLFGQPIQNLKELGLELVSELQNKDFNKAIQVNKDKQLYNQIKIYQQLQFLDAMINTFRSLRITPSMPDYTWFIQKISTLFTLTFNQRFKEQSFFVKQRINSLNEQANKIKNNYISEQDCPKHEETHLEQENKEFRLYFKDNILSSKNHVNHYSYQNIIFHTILKLVYQNYTSSDDFEHLQPNHADVQRLISLSIKNIELSSIDQKIIEAYDFQTLEHVSALAGTLVMLTQILQIFMKDAKLVNFLILINLQKDGSFAKIVELAKRFSNVWQQNELKSLLKNKENDQALIDIGMSKESAAQFRKFENLLPSCIDQCLETINSRLESFFRMTSLQITISLNFGKEIKETAKEQSRQAVYAWHFEQIKQQQSILKDIKLSSKNKYFSSLIDFLITNIELMLLPRFRQMKKIQESEKQDEGLVQQLTNVFPIYPREFFIHAIEEFKKDRVTQGSDIKSSLSSYILDNHEKIKQSLQASKRGEQSDMNSQNKDPITSITSISKMGKDEFYVLVKKEAEEMCCFLLREIFCFKNHSDQILALLIRKQQTEMEKVKKNITKIKMIQALEIKRQTTAATMEVEDNTGNKGTNKQQADTTSQSHLGEQTQRTQQQVQMQMQDNQPPQYQQLSRQTGGDTQAQLQLLASTIASDFRNSLNASRVIQRDNPVPIRQAARDPSFFQVGYTVPGSARGRQRDLLSQRERATNQQQQVSSSQQKENSISKQEQLAMLKNEVEKWSDDVLVQMYKQTQSTHMQNAYVVFATISLLSGKITKSAPRFRNPFQADKEVISKLRNNELLRIPSHLDAQSGVFKLELINSLFPFVEKFGFYDYQEITTVCQEKITTVDSTLAAMKPFTITLLDPEKLELQWREGMESYEIGLKFLRMARSFINQGFDLFCSPKKGEDKESSKLNSYEALSKLIKNICHIIQLVSQNNAKYLEKIKDELAQDDSGDKSETDKQEKQYQMPSFYDFLYSPIQKQEGDKSKQLTDRNEATDNDKTLKNKKKKRKGNHNNIKNKPSNNVIDEEDTKKKARKASLRLQIAKAEEFKKESISFFADLLKQTNELFEYYGQSLVNLAVIFFILDSIKDFGENDVKMLQQFITEKGVVELLKIRLPCEKSEQIVEKLNVFLKYVSQDRIMALANYESKIKYYFFEKCLHKQTSMYSINTGSSMSNNNKKSNKQEDYVNEVVNNKKTQKSSSFQPHLSSCSSAPPKDSSNYSQNQQKQGHKISKFVASKSEEPKQETQRNNSLDKQKPLRMSYEEFMQRFEQFDQVPLFWEAFDKICEKKIFMVPSKSKIQSQKGLNKKQQSKKSQKQEEMEQPSEPAASSNLPETTNNKTKITKKITKKDNKKSKSNNVQLKNKKQQSPELKKKKFYVLKEGVELDAFNLLPKENFMAFAFKPETNAKQSLAANKVHEIQGIYNQQINFIAPSHIYDTLNAILECTVMQFTQKILENYEIIHGKTNHGQQKTTEQQSKPKPEQKLLGSALLVKVIQVIARQQPTLIPQIVRFRCSKIVKKIITGHPLEPIFNKQLGNHYHFLKFITKCANYFSIASVKGLIFELCLDKQILYRNSLLTSAIQSQQSATSLNHGTVSSSLTAPFGAEIRKKVLGEIYSSVEQEISNGLESPPTIHLLMSNILLHISLLHIREAAKLSLKNFSLDFSFEGLVQHQQTQQQEGYNFARLYGEIFKRVDLSKMSQVQSLVVFVTAILEMLYILNYFFILYPTGISSSKLESKKKQDDFLSRFVQGQILNEQLQKHIKQYAGIVNNNLIGVLPTAANDPFGAAQPSRRDQFSDIVPFNQMSFFGSRNGLGVGGTDPLSVLSRFATNQALPFNFLANQLERQDRALNPYAQLAEQRIGENAQAGGLESLANNLRRTQAGGFLSLSGSNSRRAQPISENRGRGGIGGLDENGDIPGNAGGADEDIDHIIMGRLGNEEYLDDDEDEEEDDDQLEGIFDEDSGDEEDEDDDDDDEEDEDDDEEDEDEDDEDEEEEEDVDDENDDDDDEEENNNEDEEQGNENEERVSQREQQTRRRNIIRGQSENNPSQRVEIDTVQPQNITVPSSEAQNDNVEINEEDNEEDYEDEEDDDNLDEEQPQNVGIQIFLDFIQDPNNALQEEEEEEDQDIQGDVVEIEEIEPEHTAENEGSYFNQDWEEYSSEDEISENEEEPEAEDYFEGEGDNSAEQEVDVRDREDDEDDEFSESLSENRRDVQDDNIEREDQDDEEEEEEEREELISEEEDNVWNDCDFSEEEEANIQFVEEEFDDEDDDEEEDAENEGEDLAAALQNIVGQDQHENEEQEDEDDEDDYDDDDNEEEDIEDEEDDDIEDQGTDNNNNIRTSQNRVLEEINNTNIDMRLEDDSRMLMNFVLPGRNNISQKNSKIQSNQSRKLQSPLNQDPDLKNSITMREITELTNIQMCQCLKDAFQRCVQQISVFYLGATIIASYSTSLKEIQKEVAALEANSTSTLLPTTISEGLDPQIAQSNLYLKTVYIALLSYLEHQNFDSQYFTLKKSPRFFPLHTGGIPAGNEPPGSPSNNSNSQLNFTQLRYTPYMAGGERRAAAQMQQQQLQNNQYQYRQSRPRFNFRMQQYYPPGHSNNRQISDNLESEIQGSSLNDLISTVATTIQSRNSTIPLASQFMRGNAQSFIQNLRGTIGLNSLGNINPSPFFFQQRLMNSSTGLIPFSFMDNQSMPQRINQLQGTQPENGTLELNFQMENPYHIPLARIQEILEDPQENNSQSQQTQNQPSNEVPSESTARPSGNSPTNEQQLPQTQGVQIQNPQMEVEEEMVQAIPQAENTISSQNTQSTNNQITQESQAQADQIQAPLLNSQLQRNNDTQANASGLSSAHQETGVKNNNQPSIQIEANQNIIEREQQNPLSQQLQEQTQQIISNPPQSNMQIPQIPQLSAASMIVLSRFDLDANFLTRNGLDFQYFDELPEDIKEELIFSYIQYPDANAQAENPPVNNPPVLNQPQTEIQIEQQQGNQNEPQTITTSLTTDIDAPAAIVPIADAVVSVTAAVVPIAAAVVSPAVVSSNVVPSQQLNLANVAFVNSADVNLRADILVQSEDDFLRTLTPEMQEEAQRLRQEAGMTSNNINILDELQRAERRVQNAQVPSRPNLPRGVEAVNNRQQQQDEVNEMFKAENMRLQKKQVRLIDDWIGKDRYIYKKLLDTDDKFIEAILRLVYYGGKSSNVFPLQLLELICKNPLVEEKVFDALMFILMNPNMPEIKNNQKIQETANTNQQQSDLSIDAKNKECFDFPLLNTYHRNSKETDYKKVYHEVSLKILRIIQKLTLKKVVFFIEKDNNDTDVSQENTKIQSIRVLQKIAADLASQQQQNGFTLPFFQFIYLLTLDPFRSNYEHLNFLLCSIQNITKKLFQFHSGKQEEEEEEGYLLSIKQSLQNQRDQQIDQSTGLIQKQQPSIFSKDASFFLHGEVITWICSIFSSDQLNDLLIRKLSLIINQLCYDKNNLDMFITELRNIIKIFSIQINKRIQKCLKAIKSLVISSDDFTATLKQHLTSLEFSIQGERKIQNIFQIIYELFEKSFFQLEQTEKDKESDNKETEESKQQDIIPETKNVSTSNTAAASDGKTSISKKTPKNSKELERLEAIKKEMRSKFAEIITDQNFNELWIHCAELFAFIGKHEQTHLSSYNGIIEKLQPVMESYFIIFRILHDEDFEFIKKTLSTQKNNGLTHTKMSSLAEDDDIDVNMTSQEDNQILSFDNLKLNLQKIEIEKIFEFICEQCKAVINQMIRQSLKQKKTQGNRKMNEVLQKDPFEIIFKRCPTLIDFENKKNYFKYEMAHFKSTIASSHARRRKIKIRRKHIFGDSFSQIDTMKSEELKSKFIIEFDGEEGIDAGGLTREWFVLLSKAIFNPDYLLFKPSSSGNTYQPNPASYLNEPHLQYFKFVGRIVGKALFEGHLLDAYFTRSFYKHILGQPLTYHDIEDQDYEFYKSLKWIIENDITSFTDLTFCYQENQFDQIQTIELKPNGKHITVTEENKQEYVKLICYTKMAKSIKEQIEHFLEGFHELIPPYLVRIFDSHELELMISGLPDIDIFDLKDNTEYQNYQSNSKIIEWLWAILEEFDSTQKASFIQFVTGTSKVPVEGFRGLRGISGLQKFQIHKAYDPKKLPIAHTCFNQLDIPEYQTKEILKKKLLLAISEGKEGFGFA